MKFIIIGKKQLTIITAITMCFVVGIIVSVGVFASTGKKLPIYCVERDDKKIAISFDAAWGNDDTEELISILSEYNVPATFFVVGQWVDKYPESVKQLNDAGHRIENHSNTHPNMPHLSTQQMQEQVNECNKKISAITGRSPILFRAPYGDYSSAMLDTITSLNMYTIQWDVDSLDWKDTATPESIANRVINKTKSGSIILFHNDADYTPKALPVILKALLDKGYEFVFIEDLIYKDNFQIIHDGTQCKIENDD